MSTETLSSKMRAEVMVELDRILDSTPFRSSRRYPALLRHVVERTVEGGIDDLKERTIGVEVFHRPAGYDTNADPVVRFSAGEVRRRIAQFYREHPASSTVEIRMPVGSYIPEFEWVEQAETPLPEAEIVDDHVLAPPIPPVAEPAPVHSPASHWRIAGFFGLLIGALMATIVVVAVDAWQRHEQAKAPLLEVWAPLLTNPNRVVVTVGRTHIEPGDRPEPADSTIEQHILRPEARVSLAAVQAISQVSGFLQAQHKPFQLREAYVTQLQELHGSPAVMVTGYNNVWTVRLLKPLRFRLAIQGDRHYVEDTENPGRTDWSVDFDKPYLQQTADYAIVGRFYDATTGGPVLVAAGVSSNGTRAAGEFAVSPAALRGLAKRSPDGSLRQNFEAVLKVEVVAGEAGETSIVTARFW